LIKAAAGQFDGPGVLEVQELTLPLKINNKERKKIIWVCG